MDASSTGKTLLLWLNIRAIIGQEAIRDGLCRLCGKACLSFKERHVSVKRFWSLAPPQGCIRSFWIKAEQLSNIYWVSIYSCTQTAAGKKKKKKEAWHNLSLKTTVTIAAFATTKPQSHQTEHEAVRKLWRLAPFKAAAICPQSSAR